MVLQEIVTMLGFIAYTVFIIQFLLSIFGYDADCDIDIDCDVISDFSLGDLISFKGVIHFIMGVTTYLKLHLEFGHSIGIDTWLIAILVGIIFVIGLYYVYRWTKKLEHHPQREEGELKERYVKILRHERELTYIGSATINGAYDTFTVESKFPLTVGTSYKISKFINNKIYV